jgi:hypothetical protein
MKILQERLNDLTILCIEKNMIEHIDVNTIISDFASKNTARIVLYECHDKIKTPLGLFCSPIQGWSLSFATLFLTVIDFLLRRVASDSCFMLCYVKSGIYRFMCGPDQYYELIVI